MSTQHTPGRVRRGEFDIDGNQIVCDYVAGKCVRCEWLTGRHKGSVQFARHPDCEDACVRPGGFICAGNCKEATAAT